jgi:spore coat protein CotH
MAVSAQPPQPEQGLPDDGARPNATARELPEEQPDPPGPRFGRGGPRGPGFGPPGSRQERELLAKFDADHNGWLNATERAAARKELAAEAETDRGGPNGPRFGRRGGGGPRFGGPRFGPENREPPKPGEPIAPADVDKFPNADLYEPTVLRTLFLEFENDDWEKELSDFHNTDVEVPAKLIVDGKEYHDVGVDFRGMSSYMMVPAGYKRSLNLSLDFVHKDQRLYGYRTLNLLNSHGDDSQMSTVVYSHIARQYIPTPKANFVRVVINGENWGVYPNVQQFNKDFVKENFDTEAGSRWKVSGSPGADGGLRFLGEDLEPYRQRFTIKSKDDERAWRDLVALCRTLDQTPPGQLEEALEPMLDIDGTLRFLALDVALVNSDGYWVRSSDYSLYQDPSRRFHPIPSDMNEALRSGGGPRGGPGMRDGRGRRSRDADERRGPNDAGNDETRANRNERAAAGGPEDQREGDSDSGRSADEPRRRPPGDDGDRPRKRGEQRDGDSPDDGSRGGPPDTGFFLGSGPGPDTPPGFGPPRFGPPGAGGPRGGGVTLDPLVGLDNERTPLRSKLLAVPALRERYLQYVREIAGKSLDWNELGPVVAGYRELIRSEVERETRNLSSYEAFLNATAEVNDEPASNRQASSLRSFVDRRRDYLMKQTNSETDVGSDAQKSYGAEAAQNEDDISHDRETNRQR